MYTTIIHGSLGRGSLTDWRPHPASFCHVFTRRRTMLKGGNADVVSFDFLVMVPVSQGHRRFDRQYV